MSLRVGGFCKTGRHLLAERDIGAGGGYHHCRVCHRELVRRIRGTAGQAGCMVCGRVEPRNGCRDGLCAACRPEIAFLNARYRQIARGRRLLPDCPEGHALTSENTLVVIERGRKAQVRRRCRTCHADRQRREYRATKVRIIRTLAGALEQAA